jgi:succinate-semialdehyde dehydrogenase/glutarate-semialdehyde dehydrogenase
MTKNIELQNKSLFQTQGFINGEWVDAQSKKTFIVTNPANDVPIAEVANMGAQETNQAIEAAEIAFQQWKLSPIKERYSLLMKWYQLIMDNQKDLATLMVVEQGKPYAEAAGEVIYAATFVQWFAEQGKRMNGVVKSAFSPNAELKYTKEPVGVVGIVTPWNFPLAMITRKVAPAIAAGCSVVVKPSELTPLSAFALAELAQQAGMPKGLINIIPTDDAASVGNALTASATVRKISFTGSTRVGKILMKQSADTVKRTSMELGGNAPFIVFDSADINTTIEALMASKFRNAGQTCVCANRILVQSKIYDEFVDSFIKKTQQLKVGNGLEEGVTIGPLINKQALEKVDTFVQNTLSKGAECLLGGKPHELGFTFFQPTILSNVPQDSPYNCEEIFGPVAPLIKFDTEEQVIAIANDTVHGLAAYFCSQDYRQINRVNQALRSGMIGINTGIFSNEFGPFGGVKESGIGREGSELGIEEYLDIKYSLLSFQ